MEILLIKSISTSDLRLGMFIHKLGGSWIKHPFFKSSFLLTDANDIKRIRDSGIKEVWIDDDKGDAVETINPELESKTKDQEPENTLVEETETSPKLPQKLTKIVSMKVAVEHARKLCSDAKGQVMSMFEDARLGKAVDIKATERLAGEIEALIDSNSAAMLSVARLKAHDDYTYMHSVAVCALMLALAKQLKLDEAQVKLAGVGGLMHDLGKGFMPLEVLNKPGRLTDAEFTTMKSHPAVGAKVLQNSNAAPEVVDIALHHHEKMDGTGYPRGLKGEEISLFARMGAICDVYDAVTSRRPYKAAWCPAQSIRDMASWEGHFDKIIFNAFVKSVGIYPVGSLVRLASQRLAVVVEPGVESLLTPKVSVFYSLKSKAQITVETIDLSEPNCKERIEGPEDPEKWPFKNLDRFWQ